ncbi:PAS domain S-box protein [Devosia sp. Leaf420]|uniref:PAS domain S-box protein n=1 Tax=Devosia sp. Leaf420 TaxID=1736374 RepID=UPI000A5629E2|nr:PAS domain S-box protein [Devosia sp. Leaf420]
MARAVQRRVVRSRSSQRAVPVLSRLAEIAPVGMLVTGLDGTARYLNPAFTRLLGYQLDTEQPFFGFDLLHESDANAGRQHIARLARGEAELYRGEHRMRHADGQPVWVMLAAALARDAEGQPDCIMLQVTSIELQKRAEEALAHSENRWNFALEGARQGVWDHDIRTDAMFYSRMWRRMRGIPDDEVIGKDHQEQWASRLHPDDVGRVMNDIHKQDSGDDNFDALEYRERTRDGNYIWIMSRGRPVEWDENGNALRTIGTDTDITYLKTIEQELAAEKERLRVTLEAVADGMIGTDCQGRVTFMNPAAERFTGFSQSEAIGKFAENVFPLRLAHSHEAAHCPAITCLTHGIPFEVSDEVILVSRDGQARDIRCSASPVVMPDGKVTGAVLVFQDISQSRALQRELAHSANHDPLTGLPNRVAFDRALNLALASAEGSNRRHCLLYIDLDRFKPVNDTAGHAAGDALLKQVAETIRGACRGHDLAARLGGDEFAVLLEDCPMPNGKLVGQKIVRAIGSLIFSWNGRDYRIGASVGVAAITPDAKSPADCLSEADAACYAAKAQGRACVVAYPDIAGGA